ncbi:MAG: hypothetical protein NXI28_14000 [bacterium]|nr:hypothetical protein [bacterium]
MFTRATALNALFHSADLFTALRTRLADFGTRAAVERMVVAVAAHEINASTACGDAIKHQFDVCLLDMIATFDQAMAGQSICANGLAFLTVLDAFLHRCGCGTHSDFSVGSLVAAPLP